MALLDDTGVFIVVEGLDGCGTTEFAGTLAAAFGRAAWSCAWKSVMPDLRRDIDQRCEGMPLARMIADIFHLLTQADAIAHERSDRRAVVLDRYWLSLAVHHRVLGSPCSLDEIAARLPRPDFTVYLSAPLAVRRARIEAGRRDDARAFWTLDPKRSAALEAGYRHLLHHPIAGYTVIERDASRSPSELAERLVRAFAERLDLRGAGPTPRSATSVDEAEVMLSPLAGIAGALRREDDEEGPA